jgi:hypothetical protein
MWTSAQARVFRNCFFPVACRLCVCCAVPCRTGKTDRKRPQACADRLNFTDLLKLNLTLLA